MSIKKFCHVKKNDKVIILTGDFRRTIGVVTNVKRKKNFDDKFFVIIDSLPKKTFEK